MSQKHLPYGLGVRVPPPLPFTDISMPNLISVNDFRGDHPKLRPVLYFTDAYKGYNDGWQFTIEKDYPYIANIHIDTIDEETKESHRKFWIDLRKWVERTCAGDVLHQYKSMNYRWWWNRTAKGEWDKEYSDVKHGYWYLYFEFESDYKMFILMHGEKITKVEKYHPKYGEHILEQDRIYA